MHRGIHSPTHATLQGTIDRNGHGLTETDMILCGQRKKARNGSIRQ